MSPLEFLSQPIWQRLAFALLHFIWQGAVIATAVLAVVYLLRLRHGNARYAVYLLGFIAMSVCPLVTFAMLETPELAAAVPVVSQGGSEQVDSSAYTPVPSLSVREALPVNDISPAEQDTVVAAEVLVPLRQRVSEYLQRLLPWGVLGWFAGVVVLSVRLLLGFVGMHRWRRRIEQLPKHLRERVAVLSSRLGMNGFSRVFLSPAALEAVAIGYLRPMVLLPVSMVTQMPPEMLEAVIAHELAHIRRFDLWVNLFQRVAETLLFYHPAVWWLSSRLRAEREFCCDEMAVKATRQRATYASALENVARARPLFKSPALAAGLGRGDKPILGRVRNVLGLAPTHQNSRFWVAGMIAMLLLAALVVPAAIALAQSQPGKTAGGASEGASAVEAGTRVIHSPKDQPMGLVLYYSFDNDKGRKVTDLSGRGNHGKVRSGTYIANGKIGRAMYFNGDGDYIDIGDDPSIQTDVFTLAAWIKTNDTREDCQPILSFADLSYVVRVIANGNVLYGVSREKVGGIGTTDVRTGQWVFVAVSRDSDGEGSIYVNGRLENSFHCDVPSRFTYAGKIGGDYAHRNYFHGSIDEVRIYNRALSMSQIEQLHTSTNQPDTGSATAKDIRIDRDRPLGQINVTGTVRDEKGKAVSDTLVTLLPGGTSAEKQFRTDAQGRFSGHYSLKFDSRDIYIHSVYVLARHRQRNLAAAVRIPKSRDQNLEITLVEPVTVTGRISDPDGNPIPQASIHVWFGDGTQRTFFAKNDVGSARGEIAIDDKGSFEIKSVPHGCFYAMKVKAEGYGVKILEVGTWDTREKFIDLGRIVLAPANLSVSGVVVNENGEPAANASISLYGKGQAWSSEWSDIGADAKGNFRIRNLCPGTITIWAHVEKHGEQTGEHLGGIKQGKLDAQAGEEDVRIVVKDLVVRNPETPKPLIGKKLPDLQGININFDSEQATDKRLLICFFRMGRGKEAGESRHCLMKLVHMAEDLEKKDIRVLVVYDGSEDEQTLADLKSRIPFSVGIFEGEIEKVLFKWGLSGWWPRAILTDRDHTVISEGGGWQVIGGLDKKLKTTQGNPTVSALVLSPKGKDKRPNDLADKPGTRVIRFPKDRSMGIVYVGELRTTDPLWWQGWEEVGEAKGDVAVPADKDVRLTVNTNGVENLSFLEALGPDDIQALNFVYPLKRLDDNGLAHLAGLAGLRLLRLDGASIHGEGLRHLTKLKRLESLGLHSTEVGDEALKHVGQIRSLLALGLATTPVTDKGLAHLRNLNLLQTIALGQTSITGRGFSHLAGLESLTYAHLYGSGLTDEGLREIAKLKSLEILYLGGTKVTDRGIAHLEDLTRLRELHLTGTDDISDASLEHIGKITSLESLDLPDGVTDAGLQYLTSLKRLKRLNISRMLYLGGGLEPLKNFEKLECLLPPEVTDEDLTVLGTLSSLQELTINNSPITNEGLAHLAPLKSLKKLWLHNGHKSINMDVTVSGLAALKGIPLTYLHLWNIRLDESRLECLGGFPTLEELNLKQMPICDEDLAVVGKLSQLTWLTFTTDTVSDGGLEYLAGLTCLEDFQPITPLTDKGLYHIGKMRMKGRLVVKGHFTDEGLRHLEGLSSLRQLKVTTSGEISTEAKERLRRKLPNLSYCSVGRSREVRQRPKVGEAAPPFALKPLDDDSDSDEEIRLEGKAVLLYFWATWCAPCKASTPALKQLYAKLKKRHGDRFVMLGLSLGSNEASVRRYVEIEAIPWPQICISRNSQTAVDYGVASVPIYYVIGPDGRIAFSDHDDKGDTIEAAVERALLGKTLPAESNSTVPMPALSPKGKDERHNDLAGKTGTRVIQFPEDRSMGLVRVGELRPTDHMWQVGWEEVGEAKGDMAVPVDKDVWLTIRADGFENLSFLEALGPDDIQALNFGYFDLKRIDENTLEHIAPLSGLKLLSLKRTSISAAGLQHLTKLKELEALWLQYAEISDEALKYVGQIGSLLYLNLGLTPVTDEGLAHLRNLSSLRTITLEYTSITGTGFSHLTGLESLTRLHLPASGVTDEGLREIAKLKSLEILRLDGTKITGRGIKHLKDLTRLRELNLVDTDITDAGLEQIGKITSLEKLEVPRGTTSAGLAKLAPLTKLKHLGIVGMQYTGDGLGPLRQFRNLQYLALMRGITDEDLAAIGTLTSLEEIIINDSPITNDGLAHLAALKSLKKLWMNGTAKSIDMDATVSGLAALKEAPLTDLVLQDIKLDESRLVNLADFPRLEKLRFSQVPIRDEDLAIIARLTGLKWLEFITDTVSDGGLEYLAGLTSLENFQPLALLTDKGLYHIGKMKMKGLRSLIVRGHFTDEGLRHLEDLSSLRTLKLTTSGEISAEAQERLKKKLSNLLSCNVQKSGGVRQPPKVGELAPPFALKTLDDDSSEEISLKGKAVLLYFWATWCTPCKASTPALKQLYAQLKKRHGDRFVMLGLSLESNKTSVRRYVEIEAIPWPQICISRNSQTAVDYGVASVPMYYVIGPDGRIAFTDHGDKGDSIEAAVARVLSE
jgi:beta-lactamase regulating signal transducer with metallopeptidase domain/thiol-disulfide isomerase/thioredoxin/protocatechuate 3,4-dioxygenase beta subunit/Leucine-rich repeat (LRR) protein